MSSRVWPLILLSVLSLTGLTGCKWLPEVGNVKLSDSAISITVGTQRTITARVEPDVADYDGIVWTSSDPKVASVVDGTITGVRDGVTQITATAAGVTSSPCSVTVKSIRVSSVSVSKTSTELTAGQAIKLEASIIPSDATNQTLFWSTSDSYVATVTSAGLVVAKNPGIATITVRSDDGDHTATCQVTVKPKVIDVTGITLSQSSVSVKEEAIVQLKATVNPSNATNQEVSWSSGDEGIATVASDGTVTGVTEGTTTITAKSADGKVTATCKVTVTADYVDFPDPNFRKYMVDNFDLNGNGKISLSEAKNVVRVKVVTDNIETLDGIEQLINLQDLDCSGSSGGNWETSGKLEVLNIQSNTSLQRVVCRYNKIRNLDVSQNLKLELIDCYYNNLESLDVKLNTKLRVLNCGVNIKLTQLDISSNLELLELQCVMNSLSVIDLSRNLKLNYLNLDGNNLSFIDVSNNLDLVYLNCSQNHNLQSFDLSRNLKLEYLYCYYSGLLSLDLSCNDKLKVLYCYGNRLTTLDVSRNTALKKMICDANQLTRLDVSKNTALETLQCDSNQLTSLDVSKNTALTDLSCYSNQLTTLDVSKNKSLTNLDCSPMSTLKTLYVSSGQSIEGVTVNRSTNRVPSGTSIKTK